MVGGFSVLTPFTGGGKLPAVQHHRIKLFLFKIGNGSFPVYYQGKGRGHNPADVQSFPVQGRKQPGAGNAHQPVRLGTAQGSLIQKIILCTGAQVLKSLPDCGIFHTADPQPFKGLCASGMVIDQPENQFPLTPRIRSAHHAFHIRAVHQGNQHLILVFFIRCHRVFPFFRDNGQIFIAPFGIPGIISVSRRQPDEMPHTPGHHIAVTLQISLSTFLCAQHGG